MSARRHLTAYLGSLTRLKTFAYKISGAEYTKVYIKHNGQLNPGFVPEKFNLWKPQKSHTVLLLAKHVVSEIHFDWQAANEFNTGSNVKVS